MNRVSSVAIARLPIQLISYKCTIPSQEKTFCGFQGVHIWITLFEEGNVDALWDQ